VPPDAPLHPPPPPRPPARRAEPPPLFVIRGLTKGFAGRRVLDGLDFEILRGECFVILGRSGSGKSVTLRQLNGLDKPDAGSVVFEGTDITGLGERELYPLRRRIAMLFQGGALFDSMTVFDNVAFPLVENTNMEREEIAVKVREMLANVGLEGMENKYPSELSGGMQKRVALARALIRNPKILMLDEPTTGLDPTRTGSIHALIRHTQQRFGLTVVMVSHDVPAVFEISDRVAFMHEGRMRLTGTPAEVTAANDEVFNRFLAGRAAGDERDAAAL
jgi:phospholipid/cholesterol/gamma-HCH transport system ATP-binding protein